MGMVLREDVNLVGLVGSAAQQISSNLTKLKASTNGNETNSDLDHDVNQNDPHNSTSNNTSNNISSRVSQSLMRLQKNTAAASSEDLSNNFARNGVDVELSKEAKELIRNSET